MDLETFETYRPLMFGIAYRMLGSASDAEDIVQDTYLRCATSAPEVVDTPRRYLATVVTRLCLDRLKAARHTREQYLGPWLPEPVLTRDLPDETALQHESITLAFLVLLETLTPHERAVLLLRDVFGYEYAEIAQIIGVEAANARQLFSRAKKRLAEHQPRFRASPEQQHRLVAGFIAAAQHGDLESLTRLLAHDVQFLADGGGVVPSATRPVEGRVPVARLLLGLMQRAAEQAQVRPDAPMRWSLAQANDALVIVIWFGDTIDSLWSFTADEHEIATIWSVRNPAKLAYIQRQLRDGVAPV